MKGLRKGQAYLIHYAGDETYKRIGIYQGKGILNDEVDLKIIAATPKYDGISLYGHTYTYWQTEVIRHIPKHMILIEKFKMEEEV